MVYVAFTFAASQFDLLLVEQDVSLLKFAHLLNFIQVHHETLVQIVQFTNALAAED
jgi:hypothetical protein